MTYRPVSSLVPALLVLAVTAYGQPSNPALAAKQAFDRVDSSPRPTLEEAQACVEAHTSLYGLVRPEQQYLVSYRSGYCELFAALAGDDSQRYQRATREFVQAVNTWPFGRRETSPLGLRILPYIARMERGRMAGSYPDSQEQLSALAGEASCVDTPVMSASFCQSLVDLARIWASWLAGQRDAWAEATHPFSLNATLPLSEPAKAWKAWAEGRRLVEQKHPADSVPLLEAALKALAREEDSTSPHIAALLGPRPDLAGMYFLLGMVQSELGRHDAAISSFDATLSRRPDFSRVLFLRARAREQLRLTAPALQDFAEAIRIAQEKNDTTWAIGDAHFRRGVLYYRGKFYSAAKTEFANSLGQSLSEVSRADATAWRVLAGVAAGDCLSAAALESAARAASDAFPKADANNRVLECRLKEAKTLDQLLAIEQSAPALPAEQRRSLRGQIAAAYADQGLAAEDRSDTTAAIAAYAKALEYDPASDKARFNLGAIYIEQKRFNLSESQFRGLVEAHPTDFEALYWLGESILAQNPPPQRRTEACGYLRRSLGVSDPDKRGQFQKAFDAARCPR